MGDSIMSSIIRATTTSGLQVAPDNSGSLQLQTNGTTTAVTIDTSQNVLIGSTTFDNGNFSGSANGLNVVEATHPIILTKESTTGVKAFLANTSTQAYLWTPNSIPFTFGTNDTERMRIDSSGNVGIGVTPSAWSGGTQSCIETRGSAIFDFSSTDTGYGNNVYYGSSSYIYRTSNAASFYQQTIGEHRFFSATSGTAGNSISFTEGLRINPTGTLTSQPTYNNTAAGSTVIVTSAGLIRRTSSSLKYKKDVETLEQTIVDNAVNNLRPVWYRTKNADGDDKETWSHIGLIAEEVDLVEPRLVKYKTVEVTQDENGANVTTELETPVPEDVDYAKLSVILLAKVKQLESRIAVLEAK
jgi:hypothetical protein